MVLGGGWGFGVYRCISIIRNAIRNAIANIDVVSGLSFGSGWSRKLIGLSIYGDSPRFVVFSDLPRGILESLVLGVLVMFVVGYFYLVVGLGILFRCFPFGLGVVGCLLLVG